MACCREWVYLTIYLATELTYNCEDFGGEYAPDYVRGPYNEGGWWFERAGAHLVGPCKRRPALTPLDLIVSLDTMTLPGTRPAPHSVVDQHLVSQFTG